MNSTNTDTKSNALDTNTIYKVLEKLIEEKLIYFNKEDLDEAWAKKHDPEYLKIFTQLQDPGFIFFPVGRECTEFYCLPRNTGGYYVIEQTYELGSAPFDFCFFNYKGGQAERNYNYPKPTLKDFYANADKFPSEAFNLFSAHIADSKYEMYYYDNKLKVYFRAFYYEYGQGYVVPTSLQKFFEDKQYKEYRGPYKLPSVNYIWNGEEFVRDPDNKPYEEDLTLFE